MLVLRRMGPTFAKRFANHSILGFPGDLLKNFLYHLLSFLKFWKLVVELVPILLARQAGAQSPRGGMLTSRMSYFTTSINKPKEPRCDLRILKSLG